MEKWQNPETVALWILTGCAVVFLLALTIVRLFLGRYRQFAEAELESARAEIRFREQLLEVQEKERVRFGADLHDNLIGKLIVLQLKVQALGSSALSEDLGGVISEARRISHDLSPPMIEHLSVEELLSGALSVLEPHFRTVTRFDVRAEADFSVHRKTHLLRIVQEVIANSVKHASATQLELQLRISEKHFCLVLSDNGTGFRDAPAHGGIGMRNIALRARDLQASCKFKSGKDKGTLFILHQTTAET